MAFGAAVLLVSFVAVIRRCCREKEAKHISDDSLLNEATKESKETTDYGF